MNPYFIHPDVSRALADAIQAERIDEAEQRRRRRQLRRVRGHPIPGPKPDGYVLGA